MDGFMHKPFKLSTLMDVIEEINDRRKQVRPYTHSPCCCYCCCYCYCLTYFNNAIANATADACCLCYCYCHHFCSFSSEIPSHRYSLFVTWPVLSLSWHDICDYDWPSNTTSLSHPSAINSCLSRKCYRRLITPLDRRFPPWPQMQ